MKRPKLIVLLLAAGVLLLAVGGVVAATRPSWPSHQTVSTAADQGHPSASPSMTGSPSPAATPHAGTGEQQPRATSAPKKAHAKKTPAKKAHSKKAHSKKAPVKRSITYIVKSGDTLSGIAEWFKLHGYGALYRANWKVIGANPNLIFPGEHITITNGVMKLSGIRS